MTATRATGVDNNCFSVTHKQLNNSLLEILASSDNFTTVAREKARMSPNAALAATGSFPSR